MVSRIELILRWILPVIALLGAAVFAAPAEASEAGPFIAATSGSDQQAPSSVTPKPEDPSGEVVSNDEPDAPPAVTDFSSTMGLMLFGAAIVAVLVIMRRRLWIIPPGHGPSWLLRPEVLLFAWIVFLLAGIAGALLVPRIFDSAQGLELQALSMVAAYALQGVTIVVVGLMVVRARKPGGLLALSHVDPDLMVDDARGSEGGVRLPRRTSFLASLGIGLLGFVVAFPLAQSVGMLAGWIQRLTSDVVPDLVAHDTLQALRDSPDDPWGLLIMVLVVLVTPAVEEVAYRGMVQQGFRRLGGHRIGAVILTSCLFVFMHVPAVPDASLASAVATLFTLSLILGWLFERTGRLAAPIMAHGLFNLGNLVLAQSMA
jgi:membrane protease YdiL (CAAX protease family)